MKVVFQDMVCNIAVLNYSAVQLSKPTRQLSFFT